MVKSLQATVEKWARKVSQAPQDYEAGIRAPSKDWQSETLGAEGTWGAAIQEAVANRSFGIGVSQVSTQQWQDKTIAKSPRWAQGVSIAAPDYANKMQTVLQNVEAAVRQATTTPRGPSGSEANINRSVAYQRSMHDLTMRSKGVAPGTRAMGTPAQAPAMPMGYYGNQPQQQVQQPLAPTMQRYRPRIW